MRIAYCISGHLRTFARNNTLRKHLLNHYQGDVYTHTYPVYNASGPMWHGDRRGHDQPVSAEDMQLVRDVFAPTVLELDEAPCGADHLSPGLSKMAFRWSRARAHGLRIESGNQYDVVIDIRPDLVLDERFALPLDIAPNTLYGSYNLTSIEQGIDGEVYSFGEPHVMDAVMTPAIPEWIYADVPSFGFCGERLVTEIRLHHKIAYRAHRMRCGLLRSSGSVEWIRI